MNQMTEYRHGDFTIKKIAKDYTSMWRVISLSGVIVADCFFEEYAKKVAEFFTNMATPWPQPQDPGITLYIDLDGVMADFDKSFPEIFGMDHRSMADDDMWMKINSHASFFRDLPPMEGAVEFFLSVAHLNPVILTACPRSNYAHVARQKREWVREHLSETCLILPVMGGRHKPLFMHQRGDILIDDMEKNCKAWAEAGGNPIHHKGNWLATKQQLFEIYAGVT